MNRRAAVLGLVALGAAPLAAEAQQPPRFELGLNLETAKALGITIPPVTLLRADRVIE